MPGLEQQLVSLIAKHGERGVLADTMAHQSTQACLRGWALPTPDWRRWCGPITCC